MSADDGRAGRVQNAIASGSAIVISTAALLVSVLQVNAQRADTRAAVWPYLEVSRSYNAEGYAIRVNNRGVGPARVESFELYYDGALMESLDAMIQRVLGDDAFSYELYKSSPVLGRVMSPREETTYFEVPWEDRVRTLTKALEENLTIMVCYCSIYDECRLAELGKSPNQAVTDCADRPGSLRMAE